MEYVFGTTEDREVLKTKGSSHSSLAGFHEAVRRYPDQTVTDRFRVVGRLESAEDGEGNCYDWYEIDRHSRYTDKFTPQIGRTEQEITELEIMAMELGQQVTGLEIALLEKEG